jgi:hypothetical protein
MRSRSWSELLGLTLGAAVDGVWVGAAAAAMTGKSGPAVMAFAAVIVLAGAVLARRVGAGEGPDLAARALAVALVFAAGGILLLADRVWADPRPLVSVVTGVAYAAVLVYIGISVGRTLLTPDAAVRRAVRGFALVCVVLVLASLAGSRPAWAAGAVVAVLLAGGVLVALSRYEALTSMIPRTERQPAWPWLLAVIGVMLLVVAAGALLSQLLQIDVIVWLLAVVGGVVRFLLQALGYGIAWVGGGLVRGLAWLLGLFHVHTLSAPKPPRAWPGPSPPV